MDGHRFIDDVMRRGAAGYLRVRTRRPNFSGAWLKVANAREALAKAAAVINGDPSHELDLVGIPEQRQDDDDISMFRVRRGRG